MFRLGGDEPTSKQATAVTTCFHTPNRGFSCCMRVQETIRSLAEYFSEDPNTCEVRVEL